MEHSKREILGELFSAQRKHDQAKADLMEAEKAYSAMGLLAAEVFDEENLIMSHNKVYRFSRTSGHYRIDEVPTETVS